VFSNRFKGKILKIVKVSSEFEVDLSNMDNMLTSEDILHVAQLRPNLESLILDLPDDDALKCLILFKNLKNYL
jgi:hypothetical protein